MANKSCVLKLFSTPIGAIWSAGSDLRIRPSPILAPLPQGSPRTSTGHVLEVGQQCCYVSGATIHCVEVMSYILTGRSLGIGV